MSDGILFRRAFFAYIQNYPLEYSYILCYYSY